MSNKENIDLDALVAAADSLPPELRHQFVALVPPSIRSLLLDRIGQVDPSKATMQEDAGSLNERVLPPTVIVDTDSESEPGECASARQLSAKKQDAGNANSNNVSLVKLHARGAVGEVFVAFDDQLTREVALKKIREDLPENKRRFKRFIREAKITANLQHPGIVPIYDLSVSGSKAHYTMPMVSGSTLSELVQQAHGELHDRSSRQQWTAKMRPLLTSFIAVCNAIDYAHSQNVLHRDLKPANIMIGTQGQTLVLDWGCAKNLSEESKVDEFSSGIENDEFAKIYGIAPGNEMTLMGSVMGTIAFMSPEQALGDSRKIGIPSDIFGLGATLFNLLTNEVAYESIETKGSSVDQDLDAVSRGKHRRIEEVDSRVPAPLAAICARSMAFNPQDRYATAAELAKDIDLFLAGEPVSAWKEPVSKRAMRFVRRHRAAFATLVGALLVGFVSLGFFAWSTNQQRAELAAKNTELADVNQRLTGSLKAEKRLKSNAVDRENQSRQQLYETEMLLASTASSSPGGFGRMRELVQRWDEKESGLVPGWEWWHLKELGSREYWKADLNATANRIMFTRDDPAGRVFDSDRSLLFKIDVDSREVCERRNLPRGATAVDFNRDQSLMAIGMQDGSVKVLSVEDSSVEPVVFDNLESSVIDIRWNIGGDYIAACDSSGKIAIWQWYERKNKYTGEGVLRQSNKQLLNWSYDGKKLCWTTQREIVELTVASGEEKVLTDDGWILSPCWSHEGKLMAYIGPENTIVVKDLAADKTTRFSGHQLFIESLQWHPDKHYLLSSSSDGSVCVWDADTEKQVRQLLGHDLQVYWAAWSSDGTKVVSGGLPEDQLHVWDVSDLGANLNKELQNHPAFDWHPDGTGFAMAKGSEVVVHGSGLSSRTIRPLDADDSEIFGIAYNPAGDQIACISQSGRIWTIDARSGELLQLYDSGSGENRYPEVTSKAIAWSPGGKYLAGVGGKGKIRVWDLVTGDDVGEKLARRSRKPLAIDWSPLNGDGNSKLAITGTDNFVFVFDPANQKITDKISLRGWKSAIAWSPDGRKIGVSDRRSIAIWDIAQGQWIGSCDGPSAMVRDISWSESQNRIAALAEDGTVGLWNDVTLAYSAKFQLHQRAPYSIRWSPDGERLASTSRHGRLVFQTTVEAAKIGSE